MSRTTKINQFHPQRNPAPFVYRLPSDHERTSSKCKAEEEQQVFRKGDRVKVIISSVIDLNNFHVILEEDKEKVYEIETCLGIAATFGLLPYHPMRNQTTIACAKNADKKWSRVQILKIDEEKDVTVRFIDSGLEMVTNPAQIRAVPDWVLERPQYAIPCSLIIQPVEYVYGGTKQAGTGCWAPQIVESFNQLGKYHTAAELTAFQGIELRCIKEGVGRSFVDLKLISRLSTWTRDLVQGGVADWMKEIKFDGDNPMWSEETENPAIE